MPFTCGRRPRETSLPPAPLTPTARLPPRLRGEAWGGGNPAATPSGTAPSQPPPASGGRGSAPRPRHARLLPRPDIHAPATHLPPPLAGEGWGGGTPSSNAIWHRPLPTSPRKRGEERDAAAAGLRRLQPSRVPDHPAGHRQYRLHFEAVAPLPLVLA